MHTIPLRNRNLRVRCKELDFITYKNLTKTIYNDSNEDIDAYIDAVIHSIAVTDEDTSRLDIIDRFIILGTARDINISEEFQLQGQCEVTGKPYTINVNLEEVLNTLNSVNLVKTYVANSGKTTVTFQLPTSFDTPKQVDVYNASIQSVSTGGDPFYIPNYADRSVLLNKLPISLMNQFTAFLDKQSKALNDVVLFKYKSPHSPDAQLNEYRFSFYDTAAIDLLKLLFQEDLYQMYEFEYDLYNICSLPYDVVRNSTFAELQLMYNIEVKRQQPQEENVNAPQS
jgi:hypothetical protein